MLTHLGLAELTAKPTGACDMSKDIHKNIQAMPAPALQKQLALYRSLVSRNVFDEIMISIMEQELVIRTELETLQ